MGFQHFNLSKDTRIAMDARKAHRFVAINCEEAVRKIIRLNPLLTEDEVNEFVFGIGAQVQALHKAQAESANEHAAKLKPVGEPTQ